MEEALNGGIGIANGRRWLSRQTGSYLSKWDAAVRLLTFSKPSMTSPSGKSCVNGSCEPGPPLALRSFVYRDTDTQNRN